MQHRFFPAHGRIECANCFNGTSRWGETSIESDGWRLDNNPLAWGSRDPRYLVLGFSKGQRQSAGICGRPIDDIPFDGFRPKLTRALNILGILPEGRAIDAHICADEPDWAFGSVVRCSISKRDSASGKYLKSGDIIAEAARRTTGRDWVSDCMSTFLKDPPPRLTTAVLLSNDDAYVSHCFDRVRALHPHTRRINDVSYGDGRITWVHIVHVGGPGINHINSWFRGDSNKQGRKQKMAVAAVTGGRIDQ